MTTLLRYVGVYYPCPRDIRPNGVEGFALTTLELLAISQQLVGKPITYEHRGIASACDRLESAASVYTSDSLITSLNKEAARDVLRAPVGLVERTCRSWSGAWLCTLVVDGSRFPRLCAMIESGALTGLSLSHLHGDVPQALEVSLCTTPAREGCYVVAGPYESLSDANQYIARSKEMPTPRTASTTMSATPVESVNMDGVLKALPADHRKLISAAFEDMAKQLDATKETNTKLTSKYDQIERAAAVDKKLLRTQIETFLSQIDEASKTQFNLNMDTCSAGLITEEDPSTIRRNLDRLLTCCNRQLMERRQQQTVNAAEIAAGNKRKRDTNEVAERETEAAPAATFDPAVERSPAATLRHALSQFDA